MAKILVIEDNPANLDLMTYLLEAFGYTPMAAKNGEQGLELVRRQLPDLVICDIQMPDIDGYQVAQQLKNHPALRVIPLVAVTAYAMVGDRDKMLNAGFDGYISKPIVPETFVGEVEKFLHPKQRSAGRPPTPAPVENVVPQTPVDKNVTILIVDNSAVNRNLIRSTLEPAGYRVVEAMNVAQGLEIARQIDPQLILSDLHMPGEDGIDFISAVKADETISRIPFVFISSTGQAAKQSMLYRELGAVEFILRPVEPQDLIAKIELFLTGESEEA